MSRQMRLLAILVVVFTLCLIAVIECTPSPSSPSAQNTPTPTKKNQKPKKVNVGMGRGNKHNGIALEISVENSSNITSSFEWTLAEVRKECSDIISLTILRQISEMTADGNTVATVGNLSLLNFTSSATSDPSRQRLSALLPNGAELVYELWNVTSSTNISFAQQQISLTPGSIKY